MESTSHPIYRIARQVQQGELSLTDAEAQVIAGCFDQSTVNQSDDDAQSLLEQDVELAATLARLNQAAANAMGDDLLKGYCRFTLGQIYKRQGEDAAALDCFEAASVCLESDQRALAQIRLNVAEIKERQNYLETALQEYGHILSIARELPDAELKVDAYLGLGRVWLAQEKADKATRAFKNALALSRRNKDRRGEETARGNLGQVCHFLGKLPEAKNAYMQAIDISREIGHLSGTGHHLNHLGSVWLDLGDLTNAEECYQEALITARRTGDRLAQQKCLQNRGNLYCDEARRAKAPEERMAILQLARDDYQEALDLARSRHDRRGEADLLLNLGNVYFELKEPAEAQQPYTEALALAKEHRLLDTEWRVYYAWGKLYDEQHQVRQAREHYQKAIDIVERQRRSLHLESRLKFWQERSLLYKRMTVCCLCLNQLWEALECTERAKTRYLADLLSQHATAANDVQNTVRAVIQDLPTNTAVVAFNVTEAGTAVFIETRQMAQNVETLRQEGWELLVEEDICIQAKLFEGFNRDTLQQLLVEVDDAGQQVGGYLFDYHKKRAKWRQETLEWACGEIGAELLAPLYRQLVRLPIQRIILVPNLGLSLLPLHACILADGNSQVCLLDRYEITYAPSFDVLRYCQDLAHRKSSDDVSLLAVSNPTGDLRYAQSEVEEISKLLPARILDSSEEDRATHEAVMSEARNYALIHFACHGKFDPRDPLHSALILATPATLTAEEIFNQLRLPRTRLVVMSACETGMVDAADLADEYVGLPAGFMQAGAPSVVSSLWAVDDISTALLMTRFYEYYLGDVTRGAAPMRPSLALREAQAWLRRELTLEQVTTYISQQESIFKTERKYIYLGKLGKTKRKLLSDNQAHPFADPYYWAAFVVLGEA